MSAIVGQGALEFRKDINGLRAYAVIAVLLYHFDTAGMGGGYAGVDVFFVISGFLMTAIILPKVEASRFNLSGFYLARIRRIFPALAVLCSAGLLFGWFWLAPYLYENLGKSAGASLLFISNFVYNRAGGYFAAPAHDNWLLHTWSLSVEWQFYLLYPLLLLVLAKFSSGSHRFMRVALLAALLASFAYGVYLTATKPTSAFFMLPSRAWELLAGSLVFLHASAVPSDKSGLVMETGGLALVFFSFFAYDSSTSWPGYFAALPVLGTGLVLAAARQDSWWTGNPIAQSLGRWSYSIYLWHWPTVVGLGYFGVRDELPWLLAAMVASLVLGALSYHLVEQPSARWMRTLDSGRSWQVTGAGFTLAFGFAAIAYFDHGVARTLRLPQEVLTIAQVKQDTDRLTRCNTEQSRCLMGEGKVLAIVWGDSHAIAAVNGVVEAARRSEGSVLFFGQQSCPVIFGARSSNPKSPGFCQDFNHMVYKRLNETAPGTPVIIIHRAGTYIEPGERLMYFDGRVPDSPEARRVVYEQHLIDSLCRIAASHPVHVLLPVPEMPYDVPAVAARELILAGKSPQPTMALANYEAANAAMIAALVKAHERCSVRLLDPLPYLCVKGICPGIVDGHPLYFDDNHLSNAGATRLAPLFEKVWE